MLDKQGIYNKYTITKTDGSPVDPNAQYFVLRLDTDENARLAVINYAMNVKHENPVLADQLMAWVSEILTDLNTPSGDDVPPPDYEIPSPREPGVRYWDEIGADD